MSGYTCSVKQGYIRGANFGYFDGLTTCMLVQRHRLRGCTRWLFCCVYPLCLLIQPCMVTDYAQFYVYIDGSESAMSTSPEVDLTLLSRCIALAVGKGGVGKTSLTANIAAIAAANEHRVLIVSLDPQDNLGEDLGYGNAGLSDDGENLAAALRGQAMLVPLRGVREGLDVACGGDVLEDVVADLYVARANDDHSYAYTLAQALIPLAHEYDLILIDCPPGYHILQHLALVAARWILVPTAADASSRKGISRLAARVAEAAQINPDLALLGVVLFDVPTSATRIRATATAGIAKDLGTDNALLTATIRTAKAAATDSRERGQVMHELASALQSEPAWWQRRRQNLPSSTIAASAASVAQEYQALTLEVLTAVAEHEKERS